MPDVSTIPPYMQAVETDSEVKRHPAFLYSVAFVCLELSLAIGCLLISSSGWFVAHTDAFSGYGHQSGLDCDIVLYGDSTGLAGMNSKIIQNRTGLKTCNLSEIRPVGDFVGPYVPLDDYLAHNKAPQYLVAGWTASDFHFNRQPVMQNDIEGFEYALRYHRGWWLWKQMLEHPSDALQMIVYEQFVVITAPLHAWYQAHISHRNNRIRRATGQGWMPYLDPPEKACINRPRQYRFSTLEENTEATEEFRRRYGAHGTKILIDVTPEADCLITAQADEAVVHGLHDNAFQTLPIRYFNVEDTHLIPEGSVLFSNEISDQLLAIMKNDSRSQR